MHLIALGMPLQRMREKGLTISEVRLHKKEVDIKNIEEENAKKKKMAGISNHQSSLNAQMYLASNMKRITQLCAMN